MTRWSDKPIPTDRSRLIFEIGRKLRRQPKKVVAEAFAHGYFKRREFYQVSIIRTATFMILRKRFHYRYPKIGQCFGLDHSTVIHHLRWAPDWKIKSATQLAEQIIAILDESKAVVTKNEIMNEINKAENKEAA